MENWKRPLIRRYDDEYEAGIAAQGYESIITHENTGTPEKKKKIVELM
jgi:hypothetical protein